MAKKILQSYDFAGNQIINLRAENLGAFPAVGAEGRLVYNTSSGALGFDNGVSYLALLTSVAWGEVTGKPATFAPSPHTHAQSEVTGLVAALAAKADTSHTHTASEVTDFNTEVDNRIVAFIDSTAATDNDIDTLRELMDLVKANQSSLTAQIGRYSQDFGDGSSTSIAITHNLASLDVTVEVYDKSTGETVGVGVTRTNTNIVTIEAIPAPASNELRVVIKR